MLIELIYGILFILALFSALMVVLSPHVVYAALYLVMTMVSIAAVFVLMNAPLAGALQIIVYAGAIMVLFLFVIMLLSLGRHEGPRMHNRGVRVLGGLLAGAFIIQIAVLYGSLRDDLGGYSLTNAEGITIEEVARILITDYLYAFEMTSVLLLVAVVGAVVLARRHLIQGAQDADASH